MLKVLSAYSGGLNLPTPKIYYASRTHSQLSQAIAELKNTAFKPSTRTLGSRDQMCVNLSVKAAPAASRTGICKSKVSKHTCEYHNGTQLSKHTQKINSDIMDIEDLVNYGAESKYICLISGVVHISSQRTLKAQQT